MCRYAYRESMTEVVVNHLITNDSVRLKCHDLVVWKKLSGVSGASCGGWNSARHCRCCGFFSSIQPSWVILDGRNTTRQSLAMVEPQWSIGLLSSGSMLGIGIRKSLIMFGCITNSVWATIIIILLFTLLTFWCEPLCGLITLHKIESQMHNYDNNFLRT